MKLGPFRKKEYVEGWGRMKETHLGRFLPQEYRVHLGEMGGEHHLGLHLFGRAVQDGFPERNEELVGMFDASLDD